MNLETSMFFNSVNGDRKYLASDFADYFSPLITNGFFPSEANLKVVAEGENMDVTIKSGRAWINGHMYFNKSDLVKSIGVADGVLDRIDRIVVQLNFTNREMITVVKRGMSSSNPVPPPVTRNADIYELGIATVSVPAGTTTLTQSQIIDTRSDVTVGGIVNNLFADANAQASNVSIDDANNYYVSDNVEGALIELKQPLSIQKSDQDTNGIFRTITFLNSAGVRVKQSVLSNPDADGNYLTRTETLFGYDGTSAMKVITYRLTYNSDGEILSEVIL